MKLDGSSCEAHEIKQKLILFELSEMLIKGRLVLAPAHDFEFGAVASVKLVSLLVPGKGAPDVFMFELVLTPLALVELAALTYRPWCEPALISLLFMWFVI